jgi:hypothetical protein
MAKKTATKKTKANVRDLGARKSGGIKGGLSGSGKALT